ncbi:MAG: hypothetical protein ACLTKI_09335 [Lachnospiraceae bacterium]
MEKRKIDFLIQDTLKREAEQIHAPQGLSCRVRQSVRMQGKEQQNMRRFGKKRAVILAAAMCIFGATAVMGAGKITGWMTGTNVNQPTYTSYEQIGDAKNQLGYEPKVVEAFSEGYRFQKAYISDVNGIDENGNVLGSFEELMIDYKKGADMLSLNISKPLASAAGESSRTPKAEDQCGEVTLNYYSDQYKFVPPDYELTEEDKINQQRDDFYISYGTSEIEYSVFQSVSWTEDGVSYLLMVKDSDLTSGQLFAMAKEVIEN